MKVHLIKPVALITFVFLFWGCESKPVISDVSTEEEKIRHIHSEYVNGWLEMDEERVMGLLEEKARIQPNRLTPIESKAEIREFWFPEDDSETVINAYETDLIYVTIMDTLAISTHTSLLDWSYYGDDTSFGMVQKGINTTIYRKQPDEEWKIWRSMWTDIDVKRK